jgi:hypothetical protein
MIGITHDQQVSLHQGKHMFCIKVGNRFTTEMSSYAGSGPRNLAELQNRVFNSRDVFTWYEFLMVIQESPFMQGNGKQAA